MLIPSIYDPLFDADGDGDEVVTSTDSRLFVLNLATFRKTHRFWLSGLSSLWSVQNLKSTTVVWSGRSLSGPWLWIVVSSLYVGFELVCRPFLRRGCHRLLWFRTAGCTWELSLKDSTIYALRASIHCKIVIQLQSIHCMVASTYLSLMSLSDTAY